MTVLRNVQIDGAELSIFPWEDEAAIAEELAAFWDEIDGMFDPGDDLTEAELAALFDDEMSDHWRWVAEYNATMNCGAPADFAEAVADVMVNGVTYCPRGIDWAAVEDDAWGS